MVNTIQFDDLPKNEQKHLVAMVTRALEEQRLKAEMLKEQELEEPEFDVDGAEAWYYAGGNDWCDECDLERSICWHARMEDD